MNIFQRVDDYLFEERRDIITSCQEDRVHIRWPARAAHSLARSIWLLGTCSWTNIFLPLIPLAICFGTSDRNHAAVFALNYLALLPTIGLFQYGNEVLSASVGDNLRTTWDLTIGVFSIDIEVRKSWAKLTESLLTTIWQVALVALWHAELELVKAYIVGKIASTLLLVIYAATLVTISQIPVSDNDLHRAA
jgi:hypothetical protein